MACVHYVVLSGWPGHAPRCYHLHAPPGAGRALYTHGTIGIISDGGTKTGEIVGCLSLCLLDGVHLPVRDEAPNEK